MVPGAAARRVGRAGERAEALDHPVAGDADRDDRSGLHELDERLVERLALVLGVVRGEQVAVGLQHAHVDELVALRLDAAQDLAGEVAGDAVGLDDDEGLFDGGHGVSPSVDGARGRLRIGGLAALRERFGSIWRPWTKQKIQMRGEAGADEVHGGQRGSRWR